MSRAIANLQNSRVRSPRSRPTAPFCRRTFLEGMGLGLGLLPLLPDGRAAAQARSFPRRLLIVVTTNGTISNAFFPQGAGSNLADLTLPEITSALDRHKSSITFIENLELKNFTELPKTGAGHNNYSSLFTGRPGAQTMPESTSGLTPPTTVSPSFDQFIVDELAKRGQLTSPLPKLHLGAQCYPYGFQGPNYHQTRCFWRAAGQSIAPEFNPVKAAATVFGGSAVGDPDFDRLRAERRSLLDFVGKRLERFGQRFGGPEKKSIEAHLASVREIETQLSRLQKVTCTPMTVPPALADTKGEPDVRWRDIVNVQLDIATAALACDVSRIATVQLSDGTGDKVIFSWLGLEGKGMEFPVRHWHDIAHRPGTNSGDKIKVDNWLLQVLAGLIDKLKGVKEGNGTLFDNTAVLWVNNMGNGGGHTSTKLPWVLAGSCGGALKTGQFVRSASAVPVNGLLIALCNAMGAPTETFGDPKYGGELSQLRA